MCVPSTAGASLHRADVQLDLEGGGLEGIVTDQLPGPASELRTLDACLALSILKTEQAPLVLCTCGEDFICELPRAQVE